ncbi:MAG TPA: hypothetical protein VJ547_10495 [Candidatus Thermoplasmatota archaeon]|nr:hypothetical protein [Candidatus Thermoplasmatota archaeon]
MDDSWPVGAAVSMGRLTVRILGRVRSTQEDLWAKRRWAQDGLGIAASSQTAGVGRGARHWASPEGGVYVSVLAGRGMLAADSDVLGQAGALAVLRTSEEVLKGAKLHLKWPNDLVVPGRGRRFGKLAGVLVRTEAEGERLAQGLVGIGLNVRVGVEGSRMSAGVDAPASLEGLAARSGRPWNAPRMKVLEWLVGWLAIELEKARAEPEAVRREFAREIAGAPLIARVEGLKETLRPLGVERGGALVVRRASGARATVSVEDAERLVWSIRPTAPARPSTRPSRALPATARKRGASGRRPRSSCARSARRARRRK